MFSPQQTESEASDEAEERMDSDEGPQVGSGKEADSDEEEFDCEYLDILSHPWHHPQLDAEAEAVRTHFSDSAVSIREYASIDSVDIDLHMNTYFLDDEVAKAWGINPSEPIVIRLHLSLSQYLDGPAPLVEVFQPSNKHSFGLGKQLQHILKSFILQQWEHLSNEELTAMQKGKQSWFSPAGTIRKVSAKLSILLPQSKSSDVHQEPCGKEASIIAAMKLENFTDCTTTYDIKNPAGELFAYRPSGKRVAVSSVKSSVPLSPKQLIELLFSSQAIEHCKASPPLQHGFLVQLMKYAEQRMLTLNEHCVICDERHVFQNGPMLKPAVCSRELCVYSFHTLGVMSEATDVIATGAEVADLLVAMCRAALQSPRKSIIFEPYPSIVDPLNPKTLAFSPKVQNYERLQKTLHNILLIKTTGQGPPSEIKKQMDKRDPLAHPLLMWILSSNKSHIVKLSQNQQLRFMHTPHQFLLISSPPSKEACFQAAKRDHGSTFAFHGSDMENWHSIVRNGLVNASNTKYQLHGAAYGNGIYLSPFSSVSFEYSGMGRGRHRLPTKEKLKDECEQRIASKEEGGNRFLQTENLNCIALCEVITSRELRKSGKIWVCPNSDHVCTRFLFVYENGQIGDLCINTQHMEINQEILQVIVSRHC